MGLIDLVVDCADATRKIMSTARTSPDMFTRRLPPDALKITAVSSLLSGLVLVADRGLFRPFEITNLKAAAITTLVIGIVVSFSFVFIVIASIFFPLVISDEKNAEKSANAWTMMFCFVWFLSVLICLGDSVIRVLTSSRSGPIFTVFSWVGTGRDFLGFSGDLLFPCIAYGLLAYIVLFVRSVAVDRLHFSYLRSLWSFLVLVPFSAITMYFAMGAPLDEFFSRLLSASARAMGAFGLAFG